MSKAIVIATGVAADGHREVLGLAVGDSENGAFWTAFLRSLRARGLAGVRLIISDTHEGLKGAIAAVLLGAASQSSGSSQVHRIGHPQWRDRVTKRASLTGAGSTKKAPSA